MTKGPAGVVAGPVPENVGLARDLVAHAQSLAPLAAARGDDGATGARTHAQPEAVDLSATPVVRLKRTLAHLRLQGRVRKYIRQTPRICGVVHCLCSVATSPVSGTRAQADHRHKHEEDTSWASRGQIGPAHVRSPRVLLPCRRALMRPNRRAGLSRNEPVPEGSALRGPCPGLPSGGSAPEGTCRPGAPVAARTVPANLWTSGCPQRVTLPHPRTPVDNLILWITFPSPRFSLCTVASSSLYTRSDLHFVENSALRTLT